MTSSIFRYPLPVLLLICIVGSPGQAEETIPCPDSPVYVAGQDHVTLPQLRMERRSPDAPVKTQFPVVLSVTNNIKGQSCEIRVLKAPDVETGRQLAEFVADNFRFTPATRKGKPVAVRFRIVFENGHVHGE